MDAIPGKLSCGSSLPIQSLLPIIDFYLKRSFGKTEIHTHVTPVYLSIANTNIIVTVDVDSGYSQTSYSARAKMISILILYNLITLIEQMYNNLINLKLISLVIRQLLGYFIILFQIFTSNFYYICRRSESLTYLDTYDCHLCVTTLSNFIF